MPDNPLHLDDVYFAGIEMISDLKLSLRVPMYLWLLLLIGGEVLLATETCDTHSYWKHYYYSTKSQSLV